MSELPTYPDECPHGRPQATDCRRCIDDALAHYGAEFLRLKERVSELEGVLRDARHWVADIAKRYPANGGPEMLARIDAALAEVSATKAE